MRDAHPPPPAAPEPPPPTPPAPVPAYGPEPGPDGWDRAAAWLAQHGAIYALAILTIYVGWIYIHVFAGEVVGDDNTFHFAESARLADCLRQGDWDFWNPSANAGYASAYYYQAIPQLASALPTALFGHHLFWFQTSVFLPHVLAPAAAYRAARLLGATPWQSLVGAAVLAFANGESRWGAGNAGTFMVGLYTQTWALCAFPLALAHAARWIIGPLAVSPATTSLSPPRRRGSRHPGALAGSPARHLGLAVAWGAFVGMCHPFAFVALGVAFVAAYVGLLVLALVNAIAGLPTDRSALLRQLGRSVVLGAVLIVALMPIWLPLAIDYAGFGGFPRRVADEIGPGFKLLAKWHFQGKLFDAGVGKQASFRVLTFALPVILIFARGPIFRWLWAPVAAYALFLGLGPHLGKTNDDLFPMVRFLGAMQVLAAIGIGCGAFAIVRWLWVRTTRVDEGFWIRTAIAAGVAILAILVVQPQTGSLRSRVHVLPDLAFRHEDELHQVIAALAKQPPGRKQAVGGAVSSFWNLLPYAYSRRPSLLQMGGGGLQASPNYIFALDIGDLTKAAWLFDAPYIVFEKAHVAEMPVGEEVFSTLLHQVRKLPAEGLISPIQVTGVLPSGRAASRKAALEWLKTRLPLADQFLAYPAPGAAAGPPPTGSVQRQGAQDSPGDAADLFAEITVPAPTTFVARVSWHPRWHAYVDGAPAAVRRVTPDFVAVDAPAGAKLLQLRFERPWWATAAWLAWPLCALLAWAGARRYERAVAEARGNRGKVTA